MRTGELPKSFVYDGVEINPHELLDRYLATPYGEHHAAQRPRFAQEDGYFYGSREQFITDLGQDVHPVEHMRYTHDEITVLFFEMQRPHDTFSEKEEAEGRTAAILHDLGENTHPNIAEALKITLSGDVKYNPGGVEYEAGKIAEVTVRNYLYPKVFPDLPATLLKRVDELDAKEGKMGKIFDIIERVGYFTTAVTARDLVIRADKNFNAMDPVQLRRICQLARLAVNVQTQHYPVLQSVRNDYPFVDEVLESSGFSR